MNLSRLGARQVAHDTKVAAAPRSAIACLDSDEQLGVNAKTGDEPRGPFRLGSVFNIYSSPVAAAGRIYVTDRNGKTLVMSNDAEPKAIMLNKLDDRFSASAALVGDAIFLRGEKFLYCIGGKD